MAHRLKAAPADARACSGTRTIELMDITRVGPWTRRARRTHIKGDDDFGSLRRIEYGLGRRRGPRGERHRAVRNARLMDERDPPGFCAQNPAASVKRDDGLLIFRLVIAPHLADGFTFALKTVAKPAYVSPKLLRVTFDHGGAAQKGLDFALGRAWLRKFDLRPAGGSYDQSQNNPCRRLAAYSNESREACADGPIVHDFSHIKPTYMLTVRMRVFIVCRVIFQHVGGEFLRVVQTVLNELPLMRFGL